VAQVSLFPNETVAGLDDPVVRQALAYAIDRDKASQVGEYGYEPAANQMGIVTPTFNQWIDPTAKADNDYKYDPNKVASLLQGDGYHKGSDGIWVSASGHRLAYNVINESGYTDWVAAIQTAVQSAKAAGVELDPINLSNDDYYNRLYSGKFDLAYNAETEIGPAPYYEMREWLYSGNTAPIGQNATTNFERYNNPQTDQLLNQYGSTTDPATQKSIMGQLEQVMLKQVPIIPVTEDVDWFQYDTSNISGWPTQDNPYALPAAYAYPDMGQVLLHLQPK
ncbi:MAG TPA: ABC transporter substrate-binding protein, partial [Pseudonocardiaceae bacterium]